MVTMTELPEQSNGYYTVYLKRVVELRHFLKHAMLKQTRCIVAVSQLGCFTFI